MGFVQVVNFPYLSAFEEQRGFVIVGLLPIWHPGKDLFSSKKATLCLTVGNGVLC